FDVLRSADGGFALLHDDTLARMMATDASPEALTIAEICMMRLRNRDGGVENRMTDQKLPTLRQVFELTWGQIFVRLDFKDSSLIPEVIAFAKAMEVDQQVDVWRSLANAADLAWVEAEIMAQDVAFIAKIRLNVSDAALQTELVFKLRPAVCEIYFDDIEQVAELQTRSAEAGITLWANTLDDVSCAGLTDTAALRDPGSVWGDCWRRAYPPSRPTNPPPFGIISPAAADSQKKP
ncbi:MAG: glycerophosphodiester phosphodiesterase family protein, partial [Candidatus Devosia euplotis]|nr:glycerophosphodiester phosphodiesterase family protein [Candidatus Devosia euplotis]